MSNNFIRIHTWHADSTLKFVQDMNEPANFGTNENKPWNWPEKDEPYWSLNCSIAGNTLEHPPYRTSKKSLTLINPFTPGFLKWTPQDLNLGHFIDLKIGFNTEDMNRMANNINLDEMAGSISSGSMLFANIS